MLDRTAGAERPKLLVVHCVDAEGPLEEPLEATFDRLRREKGVELAPSLATLRLLQGGELPLEGREKEVAAFLAPRRLAYLSTWRQLEEMVQAVVSPAFRSAHADPSGGPYTLTWFIPDIVGYGDNPRRKAVGYHVVWDMYRRFLAEHRSGDGLGWHFHTVPVGRHALHYNACWTNNDYHERSLARRLIERQWFPSVFRAGGVIERNDVSFWLEQFIPFDFSSQALATGLEDRAFAPGEMWDWRGAPADWRHYHPCFYDYRREGAMKRWIFRCLDVDTPICSLRPEDVEQAFRRVREGQTTVLAYTDHDRRDLRPDIERALELIREAASGYPDVAWKFANARDAAREACGLEHREAPRFTTRVEGDVCFIESDQALFGPQPFLAVEEEGGVFYRDNPTTESPTSWAYRMVRRKATRRIGVAGANGCGSVGVRVVDIERGGAA